MPPIWPRLPGPLPIAAVSGFVIDDWGYPAAGGAPTAAETANQLTLASKADGTTSEPGTAGFGYGPYIREALPENPINGLATVLVVADSDSFKAADNTTGWIRGRDVRIALPLPAVTTRHLRLPQSNWRRWRSAVASDLATLLLPVATRLAATVPNAEFDARGHLRDDSYRPNAVLQGAQTITATAVTAPLDGAVVGLCVRITHAAANGTRTTSGTAVSLTLAEQHGRP